MSSLRIAWLLSTCFISTYKCQINQWVQENGTNGEDIWRSTSDFIPEQSKHFGTIRLGQVMSMEFDFVWWGRTNNPNTNRYEMFFRVGFDGAISASCDGHGSRYPSFWITNNNVDTLHLSVSSGQSCQPTNQGLQEYGTITVGISHHIKIAFNNTQLVINITGGGKPDWNKTWDRQPTQEEYIGREAMVWWMSNKFNEPDYNVGNGTFSNVIIISDVWTNSPTQNPTKSPTSAPTNIPTENPTKSPTPSPTDQPTLLPTVSPVTSRPTRSPSKHPTESPVREGGVGTEPTISPVIRANGGKTEDGSSGGIDGTMIGIIITAAVAVLCCIICGICILSKRKKRHHKSSETAGGFPKDIINLHTVESHSNQIPKNIIPDINGASDGGIKDEMNGEGDIITSAPYTPDGAIKGEYLSAAQREELHKTPQGPDDQLYGIHDDIDDVENNDHPHTDYLSKAQREELMKNRKTPKYSDTGGSDEALVNNHNIFVDEFVVNAKGDSDDDVVVEMQTAGYIGDNNDNIIPELPPSKKNTLDVDEDNDGDADEVRIEHMDTIGAEDELYGIGDNNDNEDDEDEEDEDEYEYDEEMNETIQ